MNSKYHCLKPRIIENIIITWTGHELRHSKDGNDCVEQPNPPRTPDIIMFYFVIAFLYFILV